MRDLMRTEPRKPGAQCRCFAIKIFLTSWAMPTPGHGACPKELAAAQEKCLSGTPGSQQGVKARKASTVIVQ